jgi:hypothetical protein
LNVEGDETTMSEAIPLPTDDLYKTVFFLGVFLLVASAFPFYEAHLSEMEQVRLSGEMVDLKNRQAWLAEDANEFKKEEIRLSELKKGKWRELKPLDPNAEEYKRFLAATHQIDQPNSPQTRQVFEFLDIENMKRANEAKLAAIQETQNKLRQTERELVKTARDISISAIKIEAKKMEIDENRRFVAYQTTAGWIGGILGLVSMGWGAYKWHTKTQRLQDKLKKKEAKIQV